MTSISFPVASSQAYTKLNVAETTKFQEQTSSTGKGNQIVDDSVEISTKAREASAKVATLKGIVTENNQTFKVYESKSGEIWKELAMEAEISSETLVADDNLGVFPGSGNPYTDLGTMLGLKGMFSDKTSLLGSLRNLISKESKGLTSDLGDIFKKAGLGDVTKKITFSEDAKGDIVIEGNISTRQKNKLAKLVNGDPELVERIKTQKARMELASELEKGEPKLSGNNLKAARTQILKDYLTKNDIPFDQTDLEEALGIDAFASETEKKNDEMSLRPLLSMKRGVLSEGSDVEPDFRSQIQSLKKNISETIVAEINESELFRDNEEMQIRDFKIKVDSAGRVNIIDVRTNGDDPEINAHVTNLMNSMMNTEIREAANSIGSAILDAHDDEHGDVLEYTHEVTFESGFISGYTIESKDADEAALREIESLTNEISSFLGDFFSKTLGVNNPFGLIFDAGSLQLVDADSLSSKEADAVHKALDDLNRYIAGDDTVDESDDTLPSKYGVVGDKLIALKDAYSKLHDKSLAPQDGIRFAF